MSSFWIYDTQTGRLHQKLDGASESTAATVADVFGGNYRQCDEDSPASGIRINEEGWEYLPPSLPAESPEVTCMKAERISMLNQTAWTQAEDAPLTQACKEAYRAWRVSLHRWLMDYPDGLTPLPDEPEIEYLPLDDQA